MSIINNKKHFLHEHLTFLESYGQEGGNGGFENLLKQLGIKVAEKVGTMTTQQLIGI